MATHSLCTVLVCSCDKYADVLPPFSALWQKFWPNCPFEVVLATETTLLPPPLCFDRVIACGKDLPWGTALALALDRITTPFVLMLTDNDYLEASVDTSLILGRLAEIKKFDASNLRLVPNPRPTSANATPFKGSPDLFCYRPQAAGSLAPQAGFWNRATLRALVDGKDSREAFEQLGTNDPRASEKPLLVTPTREFPCQNAIHEGFWEVEGLRVCRENALDISSINRMRPTLKNRLVSGVRSLFSR